MPDITMCKGTDCARKEECYRHMAKPTPHWQSYFVTPPFKEDGSCQHFWKVVPGDVLRKLRRKK